MRTSLLLNLIAFPPPELRRLAALGLFGLSMALCWALVTPGMGPSEDMGLDKLAHTGAFGLLGAMAAIAWPGRLGAILAMAVLALLAGATELAQSLVPERNGGIADGLADVVGAALGITVVYLIRRRQVARIGSYQNM